MQVAAAEQITEEHQAWIDYATAIKRSGKKTLDLTIREYTALYNAVPAGQIHTTTEGTHFLGMKINVEIPNWI